MKNLIILLLLAYIVISPSYKVQDFQKELNEITKHAKQIGYDSAIMVIRHNNLQEIRKGLIKPPF